MKKVGNSGMAFKEDMTRLSGQVNQRKEKCLGNEEATKHSLILPFFQVMGYDVYDPHELVPEYKAGWAANKEKVDYAIFINGSPVFFVEAKAIGEKLENYDAQLAKYFNSTPNMKVAVITDGLIYKFFTDLKAPNMMDAEPFFSFSVEEFGDNDIEILKGFRRDTFNLDAVVTKAEDLVYFNGISNKLRAIFRHPSDEFIRLVAADVFPKKMTEKAVDRLRPLVKQGISTTLIDMVSQGLTQGINDDADCDEVQAQDEVHDHADKIITTEEELAVYGEIAKTIAAQVGQDDRVTYKDTINYFSIMVDNKVTRWFCRTYLNPNVRRRKLVLRLPKDTVANLIGPDIELFEHTGEKDPCTMLDYTGMDLIAKISPALFAAYKSVR